MNKSLLFRRISIQCFCVHNLFQFAFHQFSPKSAIASRLHPDSGYRRRRRQFFTASVNMEHPCPPSWLPPSTIRGMTQLDRDKFRKTVKIPMLDISEVSINSVLPHLKHILFKMERLKPLQTQKNGAKKLLLHPVEVKSWSNLPDEVRNLGITGAHLTWEDFEIRYENWKAEEILKSVLPENQEAITSFSRIGHIIHVNLRDHLLPYKRLIGEVLMDKIPNIRAVVNKSQTIDNTFRNFQLELLCGDADYKVEVKENGVVFEFDFSTVYWNPRLSTEHERIIKTLTAGDVFYDVFAGVGPFSIPAGKKKCTVYANDLNPDSFKWLQHNAKRNKVASSVVTFNKDGRDFIVSDIKDDLIRRWNVLNTDDGGGDSVDDPATARDNYKMHITMNLPAMAVEFLDAFRGLIPVDVLNASQRRIYPIVHVYCFAKGDRPADVARTMAEEHLGMKFGENLEGVHFVRNVAPNKDMYRVSFYLTDEILSATIGKPIKRLAAASDGDAANEPVCKKAM